MTWITSRAVTTQNPDSYPSISLPFHMNSCTISLKYESLLEPRCLPTLSDSITNNHNYTDFYVDYLWKERKKKRLSTLLNKIVKGIKILLKCLSYYYIAICTTTLFVSCAIRRDNTCTHLVAPRHHALHKVRLLGHAEKTYGFPSVQKKGKVHLGFSCRRIF